MQKMHKQKQNFAHNKNLFSAGQAHRIAHMPHFIKNSVGANILQIYHIKIASKYFLKAPSRHK